MCCVRNPRNINIFVRVPGREESGSRPGGSVTGVTEKLFMCQMFMCLFRPLLMWKKTGRTFAGFDGEDVSTARFPTRHKTNTRATILRPFPSQLLLAGGKPVDSYRRSCRNNGHWTETPTDQGGVFQDRKAPIRKQEGGKRCKMVTMIWFNSVHTRCIVKTSGFTRGVCKNRGFY